MSHIPKHIAGGAFDAHLGVVESLTKSLGRAPTPRTVDELAMRLYKMIEPRTDTAIELFECGAPWTGYASDGDLKRLGKLQARINRRAQSDKEDKAERKRIMDKNIKRMRRANGKN